MDSSPRNCAVGGAGWIAPQDAVPDPWRWSSGKATWISNPAQARCVDAMLASLSTFAVHLLYGVTGSGKTEVYLRVIAAAIANGGQALVLVPEIALTPQLSIASPPLQFGVVAVHSGLTTVERRDAWRAAHTAGRIIIIGTRSAVFTSLPKLALIVVDEEHDASYKQHEGFRYSARDLARDQSPGRGDTHRARLRDAIAGNSGKCGRRDAI